MIATARMKFASEARPSQYIVPFGNTEPTYMHIWITSIRESISCDILSPARRHYETSLLIA